jgi:predicted NodU family carbamoyl transferase
MQSNRMKPSRAFDHHNTTQQTHSGTQLTLARIDIHCSEDNESLFEARWITTTYYNHILRLNTRTRCCLLQQTRVSSGIKQRQQIKRRERAIIQLKHHKSHAATTCRHQVWHRCIYCFMHNSSDDLNNSVSIGLKKSLVVKRERERMLWVSDLQSACS